MQNKYKIAMIGLGSIGKRHLVNIDQVLKNRGIPYSIDLLRRTDYKDLEAPYQQLVSCVYTAHEEMPDDYDVVFITNPTHLHFETIQTFSSKSKHMFIEKPVFDETAINLSALSLKGDGIYYVACPLRYTAVIEYVKNSIELDKVYSARAICSSYLPDWRQGVDYRTTYSAHLDQGGGVSIDLIHEWDYMTYLFGKPKQVMNYRGKFSGLEIDSDDLSVYIAAYEKLLAEVHLDYFGRKTVRELHLITSEETIVADIANSQIRFLKENKVIEFKEERNSYQVKEIENFFDILENQAMNTNDIEMALATLKIAKDGRVE